MNKDKNSERIECPHCYALNPISNEFCDFCKAKMDGTKYYENKEFDDKEENAIYEDEYDRKDETKNFIFQYIISFLIPLIGFIFGSIMMTKNEGESIKVGKRCIIIGILSIAIYVGFIIFYYNY